MKRVRITVTESRCRENLSAAGDVFWVENTCPPLCHELWGVIYPQVFALLNGASLDHGEDRVRFFEASCPDGGRVKIRGEVVDERNRTERGTLCANESLPYS
ncbi:MAG: TIGR04076 family protein [Clostridia bacterium]|nr:TIGR04076 family protein [Clostridia bacterium]